MGVVWGHRGSGRSFWLIWVRGGPAVRLNEEQVKKQTKVAWFRDRVKVETEETTRAEVRIPYVDIDT